MNFVKIHHTHTSIHCTYCGIVNNAKLEVKLFEDEDKTGEKVFLHDKHFGHSNWNGDMISVWAYALKELGYKLSFTAFLELYSDAVDFIPDFQSFYTEDNLQAIPVHVVYERDFYCVNNNRFEFTDQPKEFQFTINGNLISIPTNDFETVYEKAVKELAQVSKFNINPDFEVENYAYDYDN